MKKKIFIFIIIMIIFLSNINNNTKTINNKQYNNSNYSCQQVKLKDTLKDKKLSILGDSISTYDGYSNSSSIYNVLTDINRYYYPHDNIDVTVNDTWWMKFANSTGMSVLVNNSYSGSRVYAIPADSDYYYKPAGFQDIRSKTLHNKAGVNPDVIAIYLGTNDFLNSVELGTYSVNSYNIIKNNNGTYSYETPQSFVDAYIIMLHKIKIKYPNAEIFCFTLP